MCVNLNHIWTETVLKADIAIKLSGCQENGTKLLQLLFFCLNHKWQILFFNAEVFKNIYISMKTTQVTTNKITGDYDLKC